MKRTYLLFENHTSGIALQGLLDQKSVKYTIVPTPRCLNKSCGISMEIHKDDIEIIKRILDENPQILSLGIHTIEKEEKSMFGF